MPCPYPIPVACAMFYTSLQDGKEGLRSFLEKRAPAFTSQVPADLPPFFVDWAR